MLHRKIDQETGIIQVTASGILTPEEVDRNCSELRELVAARRERGEQVRVLYDVSELPRQERGLEAHIFEKIAGTFQGSDRCVLLTADITDKRHFRALADKQQIAVFATRLPAEMWLLFEEGGIRLKR